MVGGVGGPGAGGGVWDKMKTRAQAPARPAQTTQSTTSTTATTTTAPVTATTLKERAEAAKKKSQDLKTSFASATDKTSKRKQIRARLDALGAQKVEVNSGGFMKRLGRAFKKVGKAMLGGIAKGALNIPKFFNFLGMKATGGGENWTKDFEKYKSAQNKLDQWMADDSVGPKTNAANASVSHTDHSAGGQDYFDTASPAGDYLGFNAPTDELAKNRGVTAGDAKGASDAAATLGMLGGLKGTMSALDGVDSTVDSYDKSKKFAGIARRTQEALNETKGKLDTLYLGDPQKSDHFKELRADIATLDPADPKVQTLKGELTQATERYKQALGMPTISDDDLAKLPEGDVKAQTDALVQEMGRLNEAMAIVKKAESREDRNMLTGVLSTGADVVQTANGLANTGASLSGNAAAGVATQGFGGIFGAVTSLAAAAKDTVKAVGNSKRVGRADAHLKSVEGQSRTQKQEKLDNAVKLMRKNQAQARNTKIFSAVKNLVGAAGAIALTVATFAAAAALMATPVGWALAGAAAVGGLGLAVYSAYKTIKRSDDIAELKAQKANVQNQIQNMEAKIQDPATAVDEKEALKVTLGELNEIAEEIDLALMDKDPETAMEALLDIAQQPADKVPVAPQRSDFQTDDDFEAAQTEYKGDVQAFAEKQEAQKVIQDVFNLPPETFQKLPPKPTLSNPPTQQEKDNLTVYNNRDDVQMVEDCQARLKNKLSMFYS